VIESRIRLFAELFPKTLLCETGLDTTWADSLHLPARGAIRCRQVVVVRRIIAACGTDVWTASGCDCLPGHHCLGGIPLFHNGEPLLCVRSRM